MKSKILAFILPAACGAALAITLSVAAATDTPAAAPANTPVSYREYRNDEWHFSVIVPGTLTAQTTDGHGGTVQFIDPQGNELFQVSAWRYADLDVALGEEAPAGSASDQSDDLGIIHVFHNDLVEFTFVKNGVSYLVQAFPGTATSTIDILKSWKFI